VVARVFKRERVETQELCVDDICVTRDQFAQVFANHSAAADASTLGDTSEAPAAPAREATPVTGTTTITTPDTQPSVADSTSSVPPATNDAAVQEAGGDQTQVVSEEPPAIEPTTDPQPANDNTPPPSEALPATGTE